MVAITTTTTGMIRNAEDEERRRQPGSAGNPEEKRRQERASGKYDAQQSRLWRSRRNYIRQMSLALQGRPSPLFNMAPTMYAVEDAAPSNVGSAIAETAPAEGSAISNAMKAYENHISASLFTYPSTDILAYHRRIEQPRVFSHSPVFGF